MPEEALVELKIHLWAGLDYEVRGVYRTRQVEFLSE
jgi:hypothetical protein